MSSSQAVLYPSIMDNVGLGVESQASLLTGQVPRHGAASTQASSFINFHKGAYEMEEGLGNQAL